MNGGFRAQESQMLGQRRQQVMKDKEEELTLFLEMRKREKERNDLLLNNAEEFDAPLGAKPGTSPIFNLTAAAPSRKHASDDFLNADSDKNDYDWLLTPPGTPLFPSLEIESHKTIMSQLGTPKARPTALKSRLANSQSEPTSRSNLISSRQQVSSPGLNSSAAGVRRPSSSGGSRPATPTGRPTLTSTSKSSRPATPTSRATLSSSRPSLSSAKPSLSSSSTRPSLSTSRSTASSTSRPAASAPRPTPASSRSSTPSRSAPRSSTPTTSRSTVPPNPRPVSRASTPTRRPSSISSAPLSRPAAAPTSVAKPSTSTATSRNPVVPSRGASPTVKPRPWKPSEMPGFSLEAPPNLRTSLPERPLSATRGRPGAPSSRSSSVEPAPPGRPRRQSCSPSRGRLPNHASGGSVPAMGRHSKVSDNVSPVMIGNKMVERVINMRKLVPPKQDDKHSPRSNLSGKSTSSPDSSGFGRTLSKKSLDMAIRHMDIRRSIPGNLRPLMTNIPASSMYSVRSGPARSNRTVSVSDSPIATSSNASSEVSVNNNGLCVDVHELDDHHMGGFERDDLSPAGSVRGRRL